MKVGDVLIIRSRLDVEKDGGNFTGFVEGAELKISGIGCDYVYVEYETYTLEPDARGLSWKTFFTVKEL